MRHNNFTFAQLIDPVATETFLEEFWEQKPLYIRRGERDYYSGVFCKEDVESIVGFRQLTYSQLKVSKTEKDAGQVKALYVDEDSTSDINRLYSSYNQGDTLTFNFVQCYWEPAARICAELERFFNFPVGVNVYFTPRNSQGFAPHFDTHDVFVVQVSGSKSWRIYDSWDEPPSGLEENKPLPPEILGDPQQEVSLEAGDLLYIPQGYVHEARTTDTSSIHVTVGIRRYTWTDLLSELLALESRENSNFRKALPVGFSNSHEAATPIRDRLPELVSMLADGSRLENGIGRLRERLIERMRPLPDGHFHSLDKVDHIDLGTIVEKRRGMMCRVSRNGDSVEIVFPGNRVKGPADIEAAFRYMAEANEGFPVGALPDILSDESKLLLARRAVREGLLSIRDSGAA